MKTKLNHGFTLIEIIVSIGVLLLLSGFLLAGYNRFNDSQSVKQAASTLVLNFQAVRTKAAFGVKPSGCDTLVGYIEKFPDSGTYTAQAVCKNGENSEITNYTLPTSVTFSPIPLPVTFYALNRGASAYRTITLTGFGTTTVVSVDTSGIVTDLGTTPAP